MKKTVFLIVFFLLSTATAWNVRVAEVAATKTIMIDGDYAGNDIPLGDAEENSESEEDKDITEEDDDDVSLDHKLQARLVSSDTGLHILYQEILFKDLDIEVVIPPPKA